MLPSISTQLLYFLSYLFLFLCVSPYVSSLMTLDKETQYDWLMTTTELDTNLLGYVITKTVHLFVLCWSPFYLFLKPSEELNLLYSKCMEKTSSCLHSPQHLDILLEYCGQLGTVDFLSFIGDNQCLHKRVFLHNSWTCYTILLDYNNIIL